MDETIAAWSIIMGLFLMIAGVIYIFYRTRQAMKTLQLFLPRNILLRALRKSEIKFRRYMSTSVSSKAGNSTIEEPDIVGVLRAIHDKPDKIKVERKNVMPDNQGKCNASSQKHHECIR